ncbi:heparinase II/III family protein [Halosquirtibacter xylanolyticus]|uniref:heparinase II/III family protein n=1 Tax=Halosquirtibacter xylanolyticus TaxID=3374599 RepID=UPI003749E291|nr:heparinase II/III family protein [Prolixibacteraceae bacterium]
MNWRLINNLRSGLFFLIALLVCGHVGAKEQRRVNPVLFLSHSINEREAVKKLYPEDVQKTFEIADQLIRREYLFRYDWDMEKTNKMHQFDGEIDWLAMPNGDPEWCYMLNRHKYWIDLGRAYWLSGDEKYAKQWVKDCSDWIERNPLGTKKGHANTWRRIEVGIRCENWIKTYEYMKESKAMTPVFVEKFKKSLAEHAAFLNKDFSYFSKTSNWGILEYNGLFSVSLFLDDHKDAAVWKKNALDRLNQAAFLQIGSDGVQWEKSPMYHNEVLHCLENVVFLGQRFSIDIPFHITESAHRMALANLHWMKPNGNQPLYGDSDDTPLTHMWVKPALTSKDPLLKKRVEISGVDYSNYFDLSKKDLKRLKRVKGVDPQYLSVYQDVSGDLYMRSGWGKDDVYSSFHMKNLYCGHGHDDLLHLSVFAHGRDYLVDGGRFTYVNVPERPYFKSNKAHNTIGVDGEDNAIYQSSWSNKWEASSDYQNVKIEKWGVWSEANNRTYSRMEDPVMMKRSVLFIKPSLWLINDCFESKKMHRFNQYFNYKDNKVLVDAGEIKTTYDDHNLSLNLDPSVRVSKEESFWSPEYNLKVPAVRFVTQCEGKGLTSLKTLIYDPEKGSPKLKRVDVTTRTGGEVSKSIAEAFEFIYNGETYVWFVQHNYPAPITHFFIVGGRFVDMRVGLWKKKTAAVDYTKELDHDILLKVY